MYDLCKGLNNTIEYIIDSNDWKMKAGSPVDVFKDRKDSNISVKHWHINIFKQRNIIL